MMQPNGIKKNAAKMLAEKGRVLSLGNEASEKCEGAGEAKE